MSSISMCDNCDLRMYPKMNLHWSICNSTLLSTAMIMQVHRAFQLHNNFNFIRQSNEVVSVCGGKTARHMHGMYILLNHMFQHNRIPGKHVYVCMYVCMYVSIDMCT